jgi:hypothetical protein
MRKLADLNYAKSSGTYPHIKRDCAVLLYQEHPYKTSNTKYGQTEIIINDYEMYATHGQKKTSKQRHNKEKDNRIILPNHKKPSHKS